jgi:hypothetical protein
MVVCIYHPNNPNVAIQSRSELPFMQPGEIWFRRIGIACIQRQIVLAIFWKENAKDINSTKGLGRKLTKKKCEWAPYYVKDTWNFPNQDNYQEASNKFHCHH